MCIALVSVCGKYIAATCLTRTSVFQRWLLLWFARYICTHIFAHLMKFWHSCPFFRVLKLFVVGSSEPKAGNAKMLSECIGKCNEEMLGCKSRQAPRNGRGSFVVGGDWHDKRWRDDPCWSAAKLFLLPKTPWTLEDMAFKNFPKQTDLYIYLYIVWDYWLLLWFLQEIPSSLVIMVKKKK